MGPGGYSIVNVSWDCSPRAIFKPLSWHGADTHQYVLAHTQSVTSTSTRDITVMLLSTHLTDSRLSFVIHFKVQPSSSLLFYDLIQIFFLLLLTHVPQSLHTHTHADVFDFGRLRPHSLPPTLVHMFYRNTHTFGTDPWISEGAVFPAFRLLEQQQTPA